MILDIIIVVFVALLAIIGLKRGIAKTLYGLICLALAGALAYLGGKLLGEFVYNNFILNSITESVKTTFASSSVTSGKLSENVFDSIPNVLSSVLEAVGITQRGFSSSLESASSLSESAALFTVNKVISPVLISMLSTIFIIVLFIIIMLILKFVIGRRILKIFRLPVIKWLNSLLGGVLGLGEGVLIVFAVITVFRISSFFSSDPFISKQLIDSSYIFNSIYYWDFTSLISGMIGL